MMHNKRLWTVTLIAAGAFLLYVLLGFFAAPALIKQQLINFFEAKLGHKVTLGEVRFNPFSFALELNDFDLKEGNGGALVSYKRLFVNFQASSVFGRAWEFAEVALESPAINAELRKDGTHNFSALLEALKDPSKDPNTPPQPLTIGVIKLTDGRIDLADLQAGEKARLSFAPLALELTNLSTLPSERGPYKLTARTSAGESLTWEGDLSLNPIASNGKLSIKSWKVATFARLLGGRIAIEEPTGTLEATLEYVVAFNGDKVAASVKDFDMRVSQLSITPKGSTTALFAAETLALGDVQFKLEDRTLAAKRLELANSKVALAMGADGRANWSALVPHQGTAPSAESKDTAAAPSAPTSATTTPEPNVSEKPIADAPWRFKLAELAVTELGFKFSDARSAPATEVAVAGAQLNSGVSAEISPAGSTVTVDTLKAIVPGLTFNQNGQRAAAEAFELTVAALTANVTDSASAVSIEGVTIETNRISAHVADGKATVAQLAKAGFGAKSISVNVGASGLDGGAEALTMRVNDLKLHDPSTGSELARLESVEASGGSLNLRERRFEVERIALRNSQGTSTIDQSGTISWSPLIKVLTTPAQAANQPAAKSQAGAPWRVLVKAFELNNAATNFIDQRLTPPVTLAFQEINARASNLSTDRALPAQIELTGRSKDGGRLVTAGRINLHTLETDIKLKATELSLTPLQPYLAQRARLQIVSALSSADGRLRYTQSKSAGADFAFEGDLGLDKVVIEETEPSQPFLTLDALRAAEVKLTASPNRLDIADLRIAGFAGKLLIAEDQSVNLTQVLRPRTATAQPNTPTSPKAPPAAADSEEFPVSVARIRIDNSRLEYSDLALRPRFGIRMHELKGTITGVSTARGSRAQAELEARIDEYGSGRIRGEINPFSPRVYTDIDMIFRNVELTTMTPYTAKFVGYQVASGKLSMDLQYRIKDGELVGHNKIVLDKIELGERVESPTAVNLPLELAIAILKDSDGIIDLGVEVSGNLDDPQFSYGNLIWKAIGNLLTRIVTAPFRALANLFGGNTEKIDAIEFDAGADRLLPPERQKLRTVADALGKRPQLKLTVKPAYASVADRSALQVSAIRREVALRTGLKLQPGEDPGPIDYANPRTQQAIEALFVERYPAPAARDLRERVTKAAPAATDGAKSAAKPAPLLAVDVARAMTQQLFDGHTISDDDLRELAKRRGNVVLEELRSVGKLDLTRLATATPSIAESSTAKTVPTTIELGVAK